jgi:nitrogen fixation protein NifX
MIRVAFASKNGIDVDEHFGWCERFFVYDVSGENSSFVGVYDSSTPHDEEVEKLLYKIESLGDSHIVCVAQIGPKASNMVQKAGIYPMSTANQPKPITEIITSLQQMFQADTPLWLRRILLAKGG